MLNRKTICIVLNGVFFIVFSLVVNGQSSGIVIEGKADLTLHNFDEHKIGLTGDWEFYWNQLFDPADFTNGSVTPSKKFIAIPSLWNAYQLENQPIGRFGFATYRITVTFPSNEDLFVLKMPKAYSSYKLFINGKLMIEVGKVARQQENTQHRRFDAIIPFAPKKGQVNEIIIQVANFYHKNGGLDKIPVIGNPAMMLRENDIKKSSDAMLWGSLIFIGLAFLFLFTMWRKDKAILFYALLALFWAYRNMSDGYAPLVEWLPVLSWELNAKFEYIALYLSLLFGSLYFNVVFKRKSHPNYKTINYWICGVFIVITLFSPNSYFTYILMPFLLIMLLNGIYTIWVIYKSMIDQNRSSLFAFASIITAVIVFITHLYIFYLEQDAYGFYINVGYLAVFLFSAMLLGVRFSKGFFKLATLQVETNDQKEELAAQAELLKSVNNKINSQRVLLEERNEEIKAINGDLETKINERTARLKRSNKELDLFLYRASHDLRRPISTILGIDEIANLTVSEKSALELFNKVQNTALSMDKMLKKIISISEIYNHPLALQNISKNIIENTIKNQAKYFALDNHLTDYELVIELPQQVYSDIFLINKITTYLIENCFMFSPADKSKTVCIELRFFVKNQILNLIVADNGRGIRKDQIDKVFDMYFVGSEASKGNGLGLHIVKKAVKKLQGSIAVESKVDAGTKFSIQLNPIETGC